MSKIELSSFDDDAYISFGDLFEFQSFLKLHDGQNTASLYLEDQELEKIAKHIKRILKKRKEGGFN